MNAEPSTGWEEEDSRYFIQYGEVITPSRDEQISTLTSLLPAETDEEFVVVDLASGAGLLGRAVLRRFPRCRLVALDGSPAMLEMTRQNLAEFGDRIDVRQFDLRETAWLDALPGAVRCFLSSLAIHHLDGNEKRDLYRRLAGRLEHGGALLIADLVEPVNEYARRTYGDAWDRTVREQSLALTGSSEVHERFVQRDWNHFVTPDVEFDKPSRLFEQLQWLNEAGFNRVDCFWLLAGHAIYGGYR